VRRPKKKPKCPESPKKRNRPKRGRKPSKKVNHTLGSWGKGKRPVSPRREKPRVGSIGAGKTFERKVGSVNAREKK